MGELLAGDKALVNDRSPEPGQNDWTDDHLEREDRQRNEENRGREERVRKKAEAPASKQGQRGPSEANLPRRGGPLGRNPGGIGRGGDGFEMASAGPAMSAAPSLSGAPGAPPIPSRMTGGAMHVLNGAKDPGVYFREQGRDDGQTEEDEDPELAEAVEEAIRVLFGVRGIHHVGPGLNEAGEPVVLISVNRGFTDASMRAIPDRVHRFATLVALPYDLLPLRREAH